MFELDAIESLDKEVWQSVQRQFDNLIKPVGSLARLEYITCLYVAASKKTLLEYPKKELIVFSLSKNINTNHLKAMDDSVCIKTIYVNAQDNHKAFELGKNSVQKLSTNMVLAIAFYGLEKKDVQKVLATTSQDDIIKLAKEQNMLCLFAMAGAMLKAASLGVPVFLDGDESLKAAVLAFTINPLVKEYLVGVCTTTNAYQSALLDKLDLFTMLDLKLQNPSGEGSILGFSLLEAGIKALKEMDSFGNETVHGPLSDINKKD